MNPKILVVDDDLHTLQMTKELLRNEGFHVSSAPTAEDAYKELRKSVPDLMILDVRLPNISGLDFLKKLRTEKAYQALPVIFLTGSKTQEIDKVLGLEFGADDYIIKPFGVAELLARIRAVLRRHTGPFETRETLESGRLKVNVTSHTVELASKKLNLPLKEFDLLCLFLKKKSHLLTRQFLMEVVWCESSITQTTRTIDTHIRRLRNHLGAMGKCIQTVEGLGYKWSDS